MCVSVSVSVCVCVCAPLVCVSTVNTNVDVCVFVFACVGVWERECVRVVVFTGMHAYCSDSYPWVCDTYMCHACIIRVSHMYGV